MAFLVAFQAENLIKAFLNAKFYGAIDVLRIMAFYPVYLTLANLNTTYFYASEEVKVYRNIAIFVNVLGIATVYFLVAPSKYLIPGLDLKSIGVAINFVLNTVIFVFLQMIFIGRTLKIGYLKFFLHQIKLLGLLGAVSSAIYFSLKFAKLSSIIEIMVFSSVYLIIVACIAVLQPDLAGLTYGDIKSVVVKVSSSFRSKNR